MQEEEIRRIVLETFDKVRQSPGELFEESHFMDFLLHPAARKDGIKGSFKGAKRYFDFFRAIEIEFGVCFSDADQDRFYSVDRFVLKTKERIQNDRGNKTIIQRWMSEKQHYYFEIALTLIAVPVVAYLRVHVISLLVILAWSAALWWLLKGRFRDRRHTRQLYKKIMDV